MITEILLTALIAVESGGNDLAKGDSGDAIGCLQIHKEVIGDVNRIYGTTYRWPESCYSRETSKKICKLYLKHYAPKRARAKMLCALWNAGPRGPLKLKTNKRIQEYVKRVKRELERNSKLRRKA